MRNAGSFVMQANALEEISASCRPKYSPHQIQNIPAAVIWFRSTADQQLSPIPGGWIADQSRHRNRSRCPRAANSLPIDKYDQYARSMYPEALLHDGCH